MSGPTDHHVIPEDTSGHGDRKVGLSEVQHGCPRGQGNVGAVVDCPQSTMANGCGRYGLEQAQLVARLEPFLPQLYHVNARGEDLIQELHQVALPSPTIRAQVEPRALESLNGHLPHDRPDYPAGQGGVMLNLAREPG
jgi:hypothetical protein